MRPQTVYICVGLPGSGKSTHAKVVELTSHFSMEPIIRINQDELGDRGICKNRAVEALKSGYSIIVDRCNVSTSQRKHWIDLAERYNCRVVVELFEVDPRVCLARAANREGHETVKNSIDARKAVKGQNAAWQDPEFHEGIDEIRIRNESGKVVKTLRKGESNKPTVWQMIKRWFR
jgi:predicted kinase